MGNNNYCVYKHTFPNGKVYIGITSQAPNRRWRNGTGYCIKDKGKYRQEMVAKAVIKYGWDNILHEIIFDGLSKEEAEQKEIDLIAKHKSDNKKYGYNIEHGGNANKTSEETKRKISEANKGKRTGADSPHWGKRRSEISRKRQSEHHANVIGGKNPRAKSIAQFDKEMNLIRIWECAVDITRELGYDNSQIGKCCKGTLKTAHGFVWKHCC